MADAFDSTGIMSGPNSSTFFSDPQYVQKLLRALTGQQGQLGNFIENPTASPLFQNQLSGLLSALAPSEQMAQQNLADTFRGAGNMSSGIYGNAAARLQGDLMRNRGELASKLLGQSFNSITSALLSQMGLTPQLLNALKLEQKTQPNPDPSGWGSIPPSMGLGTPMTPSSPTPASGPGSPGYNMGGGTLGPNAGLTMQDLLAALGGGGSGGGTWGSGIGASFGPDGSGYVGTQKYTANTPQDMGLLGYQQAYNEAGEPVNF